MNTPPILTFTEVTVDGQNQWKLSGINPPDWQIKTHSVGDIFYPECHKRVFVDQRNGEVLTRQCTLPAPQTS